MSQSGPPYRFSTLGRIELRSPDGPPVEGLLRRSTRLAVFAYLAARPAGDSVARDTLAALFWPEASDARARNALTQALHVIRGELGSGVLENEGTERVALKDGAVWSDVREFRALVDAGCWVAALDLYGGDFLPGFHLSGANEFDRWLDEERSVLKGHAVRAAWHAAAEAEAADDLDRATMYVRRGIRLSPYEETGPRYLMALLAASGDVTQAVHEYEVFRDRIVDELDLEGC